MGQIGSCSVDIDQHIERAARGDHQAFGRIVTAYQGMVFGYLGRMGLDRASAEDVAQETFLRVWRHASQFNPRLGRPATWILTIARNLALSHLARPARRWEVAGGEEMDAVAADIGAPDAPLQAQQRRAGLQAALAQLSPADRSLLAASYADDLALADIARLEGCTQGAAKVRLHRARARLRLILENADV